MLYGEKNTNTVCFYICRNKKTVTMSSKRAKGKTTKKRPQRATSNVFAMFDQSQIQEFKEAFNMIDQNRDGFVDKEDLHDMLASLGECSSVINCCCWKCIWNTAQWCLVLVDNAALVLVLIACNSHVLAFLLLNELYSAWSCEWPHLNYFLKTNLVIRRDDKP